MSYDIYGNHLRRGYCEVHSDIPESYPCSICSMESEQYYKEQDQYDQYANEMYKQYCKDILADHIYELFTVA